MKKIICLLVLFLTVEAARAGGCYSSYSRSYYTPSYSYSPGYYNVYPSQSFLYGSSYGYDYNRVVLTPVLLGYSSPPPVNVTINQPQAAPAAQAPAVQQQAQPQVQPMQGAVGQAAGNAEILAAIRSISDRIEKLEQAAGR